MNNQGKRELCLALMRADTDVEVVDALSSSGYWDDSGAWRHLGDIENNYSTIGNQQAEPIAALAEKLVNGIDARLINACLEAGVDPSGDDAPKSIKDAVAKFIGGGAGTEWSNRQLVQRQDTFRELLVDSHCYWEYAAVRITINLDRGLCGRSNARCPADDVHVD